MSAGAAVIPFLGEGAGVSEEVLRGLSEFRGVAAEGLASNAANAPRLAMQLAQQEAESAFTATGELSQDQVHFYMNPSTGETFYGLDFKAIFNGEQGPTYFQPFSGSAP